MAISFIVPIIMLRFHIDIRHLNFVNTFRSLAFISAFYWSSMKFITNMEQEIVPHWRRGDKTTVRAIAQISRVTLSIFVVLAILPTLGFSGSSLLAFGGAGGIAVGFAAKDTLANFWVG